MMEKKSGDSLMTATQDMLKALGAQEKRKVQEDEMTAPKAALATHPSEQSMRDVLLNCIAGDKVPVLHP